MPKYAGLGEVCTEMMDYPLDGIGKNPNLNRSVLTNRVRVARAFRVSETEPPVG